MAKKYQVKHSIDIVEGKFIIADSSDTGDNSISIQMTGSPSVEPTYMSKNLGRAIGYLLLDICGAADE